jgi:WD40 repeat protein
MLPALATLTPPLCVVGAPHIVKIRPTMTDTAKLGMTGQSDKAVGDIWLYKGQLIGVGRLCSLIINPKKYCRFGGMNNGVSLHTSAVSTGYREVDKLISIHDGLHRAPISVAIASHNGNWLVTGSVDSTLRVWRYDENRLTLQGTLCGHDGWPIKCIDISTEFGVIVTGCGRGIVILWDLRTLTFVRSLRRHDNETEQAVISVSINQKNGNILVLGGTQMTMFDINGNRIARVIQDEPNRPRCAVATDCPEWMDQGIVAVSGHLSGEVRLWGLEYEKKEFILRHVMAENPHTSPITVLRVTGTERQDTLLVGDSSGKMTACKTVQLDSFSPDELDQVIEEVSSAAKVRDAAP